MSQVIDTKVVEMQFDNSKFEKNIEVSLNSLKFLNKNIEDAGKNRNSLDELAKAGDQVGMAFDNMNMKSKISLNMMDLLAGVGTKAFNKISDAVAGFALNMANSLSGMQAMRDGFAEYELKMGSVQTILAGAKIFDKNGKSIEDEAKRLDIVNQKLEDLNAYSDKTIYSFKDMTSNIGKFTNAGVSLDDSVQAIQGVANVAAVSGANAGEASRAMYNFSQALSSGAVKLIDWKSIENANMATVEFKQQLLDTAVALGTVVKEGELYQTTTTDAQGKVSDWFNSTTKFNDALSNQWMTTEVLTQTLKNYSTDVNDFTDIQIASYKKQLKAAGYTKDQIVNLEKKGNQELYREYLLTIGYTEKQADGILKLSEKAFNAATEVKTFSQMIDTLKESLGSGWAQTFEIIFGDFREAKALWTSLNNTIDGILSPIGKARNEMLKIWKEDGGRDALIQTFKNLYTSVTNLIKPFKDLWKAFTPNTNTSGKMLATISKWLEKITGKLATVTEKVGNVISKVLQPVIKLGNKISAWLMTFVGKTQTAFGKIKTFLSPLKKGIDDFAGGIKKAFSEKIVSKVGSLRTSLSQTFSSIKENVGKNSVVKKLVDAFNNLKTTIQDLFGRVALNASNFAGKFVTYFEDIWKAIKPLISTSFTRILKSLSDAILPKLQKAIEWVASKLKKFANALSKINIKDSKFYKGIAELPDKLSKITTSKAFSKLKEIATSIKDFGKEAIDFLSEKLKTLKTNLEAIKMPDGLSNIFKTVKDFIKNIFGGESVGEKVTGVTDSIKGAGKETFGKTKELTAFQKFLESVSTAFDWLKNAANDCRKAIKTFIDFVVENTPKAFKSIHDFIAGEDGIISMTDITDAFDVISYSISTLMRSLGILDMGKAAKNISGSVGDIAESVTDLLKKTSNKMNMGAMKDFAIAIGILAGSLFLLAMIPSQKLAIAAGVLLVLGGALAKFFSMVSKTSMDITKTAGAIPIGFLLLSIATGMIGMALSIGMLVGALALLPKVIKQYNNLGDEFRTGMDRVKEVLTEIFNYLDSLTGAKYGLRGAAAILALVFAIDKIRRTIIKYAGKKMTKAMEKGLERIKEVLNLLGDFLSSVAVASINGINIGINFNTLGIAAIIWALGDMIDKIAEPMKKLSQLSPSQYDQAFDGLGKIFNHFFIFLAAMSGVLKVTDTNLRQWIGIAATITLFASSIRTIVEQLATLTNVIGKDPGAYTYALFSIELIMISLAGVLFIIGNMKTTKAAAPLFALTLVIGALTACLVALTFTAGQRPGKLLASVLALGGLMIALGFTLKLIGDAAHKVTIGDVVMLIAVTGAMYMLTLALRRLAKSGDPNSIISAGLALGVAAMSIAGALYVLNGLTLNPLVIVGLALLTAAIWGIVFAIRAFKSSSGEVQEGSKAVSEGVQNMGDEASKAVEQFAMHIDVGGLIDSIGHKIGEKIKNFNLGEYIRGLIEQLKADALNWAQDMIDIGTNLIDGLSQAISNPSNVEKVKGCMVELGKALLEGFKLFLGINSPSTVMIEQGNFIIDGLVQGLMNFPGKIAGWVTSLGQSIVNGVTGFFEKAKTKGAELVDNIGDGIQKGKEFIKKKAAQVGKAALDKVAKANDWAKKATQSANAYGKKLSASKNPIKSAAGKMIVGATTIIGTTQKNFKTSANLAASAFSAQIKAGKSPAQAAGKALVTGAKAAFNGIKNSFNTFGQNAAQGFKAGINSMISSIAQKAAEMVRKAKEAAKNEQHSSSPSKDFMEFGDWAAQGYAIGLRNKKAARLIENNARGMVDVAKNAVSGTRLGFGALSMDSSSAVNSLAFAMSQISDTLDDTLNSDPVIRPVIDMSNVDRNSSAIASLFGDRSISANAKFIQEDFNQAQARKIDAMSANSINKLASKIASMTDSMNSRSLNNYITVDGASDPEAFADDLIRSFRLNARTV